VSATKLSKANPLSWLASLRLTVVLLALSMYLIFVGTLAQVEEGIWQVVETYFRSIVVWVPFDVFRALLFPGSDTHWGGGHWFPGGFLIIGLLLVNLLAAHALRFKIAGKGRALWLGLGLILVGSAITGYTVLEPRTSATIQQDVMLMLGIWAVPMAIIAAGCFLVFGRRKAGIVLVHAGLILMLLGEYITGIGAEEGRMMIPEFGSSNLVVDAREVELAFVAEDEDGKLTNVVIPESMIVSAQKKDEKIQDAALPLSVRVDAWMANSSPLPRLAQNDPTQVVWSAAERPEVTGTEQSEDRPSAVVTLYDDGERVGQYTLSTWEYFKPVPVEVDGKTWEVALRFKHMPLDYTLQLNDFRHDTFTGTRTARNYSADLWLQTANESGSRDAYIKMNQPLRYDGKAFFQSGFFQKPMNRNLGTILQVADNPGAWVPYLSCVVVTVGLTVHFVASLTRFGRRTIAKS
jgi:hypothetical protein